jgi:RNA polymerase sigma-70 factor, ECF subfamily
MNLTPQMTIDLVARCQRGDESAFDELYDRFGPMIWRLCLRMAGSMPDAEDLAQDTWVQVWTRIASFRCESAFSTWLYRVATNVCLQWLRRSKPGPSSIEDMDQLASNERSPAECVEMESILSELGKLPEALRLPLILRVNEELSYSEIADILDCTTAAVKMRIARARLSLAKTLEVEMK